MEDIKNVNEENSIEKNIEENLEKEETLKNLSIEENEKKEEEQLKNEEQKKQDSHHEKKKSIHEELEKLNHNDLVKKCKKLLKENDKLKHTILEKEQIIEEKEKQKLEYLDKYKRSLAEMENLRKRTMLEKQDSLKYANFNIISDLLVILDDFQRAIENGKNGITDINNYIQGIEMIEKHFIDLLFKKYGVKKYGEKGEDFNPNIHQAMMMEEGDFEKETVIELFRNGYMLHDRVIRPAQVKIGKPKN